MLVEHAIDQNLVENSILSTYMSTDIPLLTKTLTDCKKSPSTRYTYIQQGSEYSDLERRLVKPGCITHTLVSTLKKTTHSFVLHISVECPQHIMHCSRCRVYTQEQDKERALVEGRDNKQTEMPS